MKTARLADLGLHLSSRNRARQLRDEVVCSLQGGVDRITVDLAHVRSISDSFADEFFAVLAQQIGAQEYEARIAILNASVLVRAAIDRAVRARLVPTPQKEHTFELSAPPADLDLAP